MVEKIVGGGGLCHSCTSLTDLIKVKEVFFIRCPYCGARGSESPTEKEANANWKKQGETETQVLNITVTEKGKNLFLGVAKDQKNTEQCRKESDTLVGLMQQMLNFAKTSNYQINNNFTMVKEFSIEDLVHNVL